MMSTASSFTRTKITVTAIAIGVLAAAALAPSPRAAAAARAAAGVTAAAASLAATPMAPPPAASTCTGTAAARVCDLWAKAGTVSLPGTPNPPGLPVWGFTDTAAGAAGLVGPTVVLQAGDAVIFHLHNMIAGTAVSLNIPAVEGLVPASDHTGAVTNATADYTFTASRPGTYLYEAGATTDQRAQLAMGLIGALIVRPASVTQAYDDPSTAFTDEAVLVLSDLDPRVNNSADPTSFNMRTFTPSYRLINGHSYPDTETVSASVGGQLLMRMVNGGSQDHALSLFGPHQRVISDDSAPLSVPQQYSVAAETIAAGQSLDTIVSIPAAAPSGRQYLLADAGGELFNPQGATPGASVAFGGMLTTIVVGGAVPPPTCTPSVNAVSATPTTIAVGGSTTLSATLTGCTGYPLTGAAYSDGPGGPWKAMNGTGPYTATVTGLVNGSHTLYVRATDARGPGTPGTVVVYVDGTGPTTSGVSGAPDPHRTAAGKITVRATGDDRVTGGANVTAAEAFDTVVTGTPTKPSAAPGSGTSLGAPKSGGGTAVAGFSGLLTVGTASGQHAIWVRTKDARNKWGDFAYVLMTEDNGPPVVSGPPPSMTPNPTDGQVGINPQSANVKVTVTVADALSVVTGMRGWIDTVSGPGAVFLPSDGAWNSTNEVGQLLIPLTTIRTLPDGVHYVRVQATDAAGNNSAIISVQFTVDKTAPVITALTRLANPRRITVTGSDAVGVTGAEYFLGADPGVGHGTQVPFSPVVAGTVTKTFTLTPSASGTYGVRLRDAFGHWSAVRTVVVP